MEQRQLLCTQVVDSGALVFSAQFDSLQFARHLYLLQTAKAGVSQVNLEIL